jgi:hypothetical protein
MNAFQIFALITLGLACIWTLYAGVRHGRPTQFLLTLVLATALLFILRPDLATIVARFLGIGRGADLVSYLTALAVLGCYSLIFAFERRIRIQLTELSRAIALIQFRVDSSGERQTRATSEAGSLPPA